MRAGRGRAWFGAGVVAFLPLLAVGGGSAAAPGQYRLHLRSVGSFDPAGSLPRLPEWASRPGRPASTPGGGRNGAPSHWIVQFRGAVQSEWRSQVEGVGARLVQYLPDHAFVTRIPARVVPRVLALRCVRRAIPLVPGYVIDPAFPPARSPGRRRVRISTFELEDLGEVMAAVQRLGGVIEGIGTGGGGMVSAIMSAAAARAVATVFGVSWVELRRSQELSNDRGSAVMNVPAARTGIGLYGHGQVAAVCDTGLDTGDNTTVGLGAAGGTIHEDFRGRIAAAFSLNDRGSTVWSDPNGHGTHTMGSVLGSGIRSGADPSTLAFAGSYAGVAPAASLVVQSILNNAGTLFSSSVTDIYTVFQQAYEAGARLHSNSWGDPTASSAGAYTTDSRSVDRFAFDNPEMLICFSAGNSGSDADGDGVVNNMSVTPPSTAKNCLTVGATENDRGAGFPASGSAYTVWSVFGSKFGTAPIAADTMAESPVGMAAFSSRGPCTDVPGDGSGQKRIKPDIAAPGTHVASCRSSQTSSSGWGRLGNVGLATSGGTVDSSYHLNGGTSMACPLMAGMATVTRQFYQERMNHPNPTAALVKATLLASAFDIYSTPNKGQYAASGKQEQPSARPNAIQGWGRGDLRKALIPGSHVDPVSGTPYPNLRLLFADARRGLTTGEADQFVVNLSSGTPVNVVLAYTDPPAVSMAAKTLVNNLDLDISGPAGFSASGNGWPSDLVNNVEGIDIGASLATGSYTITVSGANVPQGPQSYALVIYGDATAASRLRVTPSEGRCVHGGKLNLTALWDGQPTTAAIWSVVSGGGAFEAPGVYAAPASGTTAVVRAAFGGLTADAVITLVSPSTFGAGTARAYFELPHTWTGDITSLTLGAGTNPDNPLWSTTVSAGSSAYDGTEATGRIIRDVDISAGASFLPPQPNRPWFLRAVDTLSGDSGSLEVFRIDHDGTRYQATGLPAAVPPTGTTGTTTVFINGSSSAYTPVLTARFDLFHTRPLDMSSVRVKIGTNPASPLFQTASQPMPSPSPTSVSREVDLTGALAYLPPGVSTPVCLEITDSAGNSSNSNVVSAFYLTVFGTRIDARGLPAPIADGATTRVWIDTAPPAVSITSPAEGAAVSGSVSIEATASDNDKIRTVEFYVDDRLLGTDNTAPYSWNWNTNQESNGPHRLSLVAHDVAGNRTEVQRLCKVSNSTPRPNVVMSVTNWQFNSTTRELTAVATLRNTAGAGNTAYRLTLERVVLLGTGAGISGWRQIFMQPATGMFPYAFPPLGPGDQTTLQLKVIVPPEVTSIPRWTSTGFYYDAASGGTKYYL